MEPRRQGGTQNTLIWEEKGFSSKWWAITPPSGMTSSSAAGTHSALPRYLRCAPARTCPVCGGRDRRWGRGRRSDTGPARSLRHESLCESADRRGCCLCELRDDGEADRPGERLLERNSAPPARRPPPAALLALLPSHPGFSLLAAGSPGADRISGGNLTVTR